MSLKHVGIIMDGNGRWAQSRNRPRPWGHVRGADRASDVVEEAMGLNLDSLTLYSFSTENWSRPFAEITTIFGLFKKFLNRQKKRIVDNNIRFRVLGDYSKLPDATIRLIEELTDLTKSNNNLDLNIAFGYGGRKEIVNCLNKIIADKSKTEITEQDISDELMISDIDLLIRTGGDQRVSNFMLWQIAYAELYFSNILWPDFTREEFRNIIKLSSARERRFGAVPGDEENQTLKKSSKQATKNLEIIGKKK